MAVADFSSLLSGTSRLPASVGPLLSTLGCDFTLGLLRGSGMATRGRSTAERLRPLGWVVEPFVTLGDDISRGASGQGVGQESGVGRSAERKLVTSTGRW